jgi:nucleoside 2-deoxyribosyltransferase
MRGVRSRFALGEKPVGRPPLNEASEGLAAASANAERVILSIDVMVTEDHDIIIANLTPFPGASADAGTLG